MNIGILGTGMVGARLGTKLASLGHRVMMGSRSAANEAAASWAKESGPQASHGTFADAAAFGEVVLLCTKGAVTLDVLALAGPDTLAGKIVIDITNPLDFSQGMPPSLLIVNTNSLGEEIQKAIPDARVVKALNIVSNEIMVDPGKTGGDPTMFICGNDPAAKETVRDILLSFGWKDIIDLGDITNARGTEMILPLWVRTWGALQDGNFAIKILRKK